MKRTAFPARLASLMLAFALVITAVVPFTADSAFADTENSNAASDSLEASAKKTLAETTITGYSTAISAAYKKKVKFRATVSPAGGRTVLLQRYNSSKGTWSTIKKKTASSSAVSFTISKKQHKKTTSLWRIYAPATKSAEAAVSQNIKLTTRNIKSYKLSAKAACIYRIDGDGQGAFIYTKNSSKKRAQASTTKVMSAVVLIESGLLDTVTTVSRHAASTPYGSGVLKEGDEFSTRDMLYAMMLPSSNDAATAVAETVGGTEAGFVNMMNAKAAAMGLTKTHFCNPHGLDANGHYTTAAELAKLTAYAYTIPEIRDCWATRSKTIYSINGNKKWTLRTTNSIFSYVKNFLGGKTGTEDNARCCFTGVYTYKGSTYVTVVLGSGYGFSRWADTKKLHKYIRKYAAKRY